MAVTKIWSHKRLDKRDNIHNDVRKSVSDGIYYAVNPEKTTVEGMERILAAGADDIGRDVVQSIMNGIMYAENETKTVKSADQVLYEDCFSSNDECRLVTGFNCEGSEAAIDQFVDVKMAWKNMEPKITHMHAIQSFKGQECSPELAHEIGKELARKMWADRFQVVVCTHMNTENIHNHFIINATSFEDGKRLYRNDEMYGRMREESDLLCMKYGLDVIKPGKALHGKSYYYKELERNGAPTRLAIARVAIDLAIENSYSLDEMIEFLEKHDYECDFSPNHKHWTIRSLGWEKPVRLSRLEREYGEGYSKEGIFDRLEEEKSEMTVTDSYRARSRHIQVRLKGRFEDSYLLAFGIRGYYFHYLYLLGVLPKKRVRYNARYAAMLNWAVRDDLLNIQSILDEAKLLNHNKIHTEDELLDYQAVVQNEMEVLQRDFKKEKRTKEEMKAVKEQIKDYRKQVRMCNMILARTEKMKAAMALRPNTRDNDDEEVYEVDKKFK